jgi:DNA-binding transcriptional LysR family regulator
MHTFTASRPDVRIDIRQMDTADQLVALQDGRLAVGFVRSALPTPGLRITAVNEEPFPTVLASDHRLTTETEIPLGALAGEPFVLWPRRASVGFYDEVIAACRRLGFSPWIRFEAAGAETLLGLIAAGLGVRSNPSPIEISAVPASPSVRSWVRLQPRRCKWPIATGTPADSGWLPERRRPAGLSAEVGARPRPCRSRHPRR